MMRAANPVEGLDVRRPTLVIDRERALRNLRRMVERAAELGVGFRPHFKTHQALAIGDWFRDFGVRRITVSSVTMARCFASDGWDDITIAFPVNLREIDDLCLLAETTRLGLILDSVPTVVELDRRLGDGAHAWIKVDAGYGRAGVDWDDEEALLTVARAIASSRRLRLSGILSHNGLTYRERDAAGVRSAHEKAMSRLRSVRDLLEKDGFSPCALSVGDTPSASLADDFEGVDEIRPGNFIFYDLMQATMGSCAVDDIAVAVACPVVGVYPRRGTAVIYGGAVHLSTQSLPSGDGSVSFGVARVRWPGEEPGGGSVGALSQEHGVVSGQPDWIEGRAVGEVLCVLPVHSCLTCALHGSYTTLEGDTLQRLRT